jgi:hypothetical protein
MKWCESRRVSRCTELWAFERAAFGSRDGKGIFSASSSVPPVRQARFALSLSLSLSQLAQMLFAAWGVKRSDREADYFHSDPRLGRRSDLFRCEIRKPFGVQWL